MTDRDRPCGARSGDAGGPASGRGDPRTCRRTRSRTCGRKAHSRRGGVVLAMLLLGACVSAACGPADDDEAAAPGGEEAGVVDEGGQPEEDVGADPAGAVDTVADWTAGIVERGSGAAATVVQNAVHVERHDGFDRIAFHFEGATPPGYHIEYIDRPVRKCGSGATTEIAGDGWLEIRFEGAVAHDEEGRPTVAEREQMYELPIVRELELTCDFEAVVVWVAGAASPNRYRVLELDGPPRLVVDVRH